MGTEKPNAKPRVGGLVGGLAGIVVRLFRTVGQGFLTVMFGLEVAEKSDVRKVVVGGLLVCSIAAFTVAFVSGDRHGVELFMAVLFGGGGVGTFLALGSLWLIDSSFD